MQAQVHQLQRELWLSGSLFPVVVWTHREEREQHRINCLLVVLHNHVASKNSGPRGEVNLTELTDVQATYMQSLYAAIRWRV